MERRGALEVAVMEGLEDVEDRIPRTFGQYRLGRVIGKGGMARVFEGEHLGLRKRVAVKVMDPHMARNEVLRTRFLREGERAARVRHANIVDITDVGEVGGLPFLVMEYLEGENLAELLDRELALPLEQAANLMLPVIAAVAAGHELGVVHRDLKPENVFLHRDGALRVRPKVLDFGVSRAIGQDARDRLTVPNSVLGTPYYMAPEQARGEECDERADQYALGSIFFEMLTGRRARDADTLVELLALAASGVAPRLSSYLPAVDPALDAAVARALAPVPEDRFPSVTDLAFALLPYATARARDYWTAELSGSSDDDDRSFDHLPTIDDELTHVDPGRLPPVGADLSPTVAGVEPDDDALDLLGALPAPRMPTGVHPRAEAAGLETPLASSISEKASAEPAPPAPAPRRLVPYLLTAIVGAVVALGAVEMTRSDVSPPPSAAPSPAPTPSSPPEASQTVAVTIDVSPDDARVYLDDALLAQGAYEGKVQRDGKTYELRVEAPGYTTARRTFVAEGDVFLSFLLAVEAPPGAKAAPAPRVVQFRARPLRDSSDPPSSRPSSSSEHQPDDVPLEP